MSRIKEYKGPKQRELLKVTLDALNQLDSSGRVNEIEQKIIQILNLPDDIIEFPHGVDRNESELVYQAAWARTILKNLGYISNTKRSVWVLTQKGQDSIFKDLDQIIAELNIFLRKKREIKKKLSSQNKAIDSSIDMVDERTEELENEEDMNWRQELKDILKNLNPFGFERLAQRVLRESGFLEVEITKKTGDGGLDGKGLIQLNNLVSIPVIFECKRYQDPIGSAKIRNFRGAMEGRANKGLFITTSSFTRDAREEAIRDGASPIDLIDGDQFIDILKDLNFGVNVEMVEKVKIDKNWFETYQ